MAKVKTLKGKLQRPVKKLIPLEIRQGENISPLGLSSTQMDEIAALEKQKSPKTKTQKKEAKKKDERKIEKEISDNSATVRYSSRGRMIKPVQRLRSD